MMGPDRWRWYTATQVQLDCSGQAHWVRWEHGQVVPLNHSEGEETLAALAGSTPACFELVHIWKRHVDDLRVLALASRGPGDPLIVHPQTPTGPATPRPLLGRPAAPRPMVATVPPGWPVARAGFAGGATAVPGPVEDPLFRLFALAGPLADRLVATVAQSWAERLRSGNETTGQHPALVAALYGRSTAAIRSWLGAPGLAAEVHMTREDEQPTVSRDDHGVGVSLPFSWISEVYCRGLAVVLGHFVLRVARATETEIVLDAVGTDLEPRQIRINL